LLFSQLLFCQLLFAEQQHVDRFWIGQPLQELGWPPLVLLVPWLSH
jgi:hypothetical protein